MELPAKHCGRAWHFRLPRVEDANPRDFFVPSLLGLHVILPLLFPNCKDSHGRSTSTCLEKTGP